jgi:hypothetical protein
MRLVFVAGITATEFAHFRSLGALAKQQTFVCVQKVASFFRAVFD